MRTPEASVKDAIKTYLAELGCYYFMPVQMGYGRSTLDFLVCYRGQFVAIEAKKKGKPVPTARQTQIMREIIRAGGHAFVADDVETVSKYFEGLR